MEKSSAGGHRSVIAFSGDRRVASGAVMDVALAARSLFEREPSANTLVLDAVTSETVELDLRGSADDVRARLGAAPSAKPSAGRPKMGVTAKEVTLLPRHWEWLGAQRGGASATIRRLVDEARRSTTSADERRAGQDALYRFATVMAGDAPGYEEALRALFAHDDAAFGAAIERWPSDVRTHAAVLATKAFGRS